MNIKSAPGVFDILPNPPKEQWKSSHLWTYVERVMRETAAQYGFQEIRTPLFEKTELFARGVGEETDIVAKEMYTFQDKGGRSLTLRPEGTASVARAMIEHHMTNEPAPQKFFYIGPMFRYERAQAGRYRQHHQFGAEAIGNPSAEQDAELIDLLYTIYCRLGLKNLHVQVNSLGDKECRSNYREALKEYLKKSYNNLSEDSQKRFEKNPLRILDSKDPQDKEIVAGAPSILDFLSEECKNHFAEVLLALNALDIPYEINDKIVRGLDYYNRTVFEVVANELGAQNSIGAGGRYDGLIETLGGPCVPSSGFATGMERVIQTMLAQNVPTPKPYSPTIFLIPLGKEAREVCFKMLHELRKHEIAAEMAMSERKLNKVMGYASQIGARFVAVIGENELKMQKVALKNMSTQEVIQAPLSHLSKILRLEVGGEDFIRVWKEMNTPFETTSEAEFFLQKIETSIEATKNLTKDLQSAMKKIQDII